MQKEIILTDRSNCGSSEKIKQHTDQICKIGENV